ncbi:TPA: 50S ribosomal protein L13 [Candidatus Woesearchaeota archaeon]|nr:50S ribosomal protein L13 [Candidatus Woesearchaeota archaeon]
MLIDATNLVLGRMATIAAKHALNGESVTIINCEKAVVTGSKESTMGNYSQKFELGQVNQGPYFPRRPDMLVRRAVRGMLPRKKPRGRAALGRVMCFIGTPEQENKEEATSLPEVGVQRIKRAQYITVNELCRHLGYKLEPK